MHKYSLFLRSISLFLAINILLQTVFPFAAYALTSGPTQPEVSSFTPINASDMVDPFSGDFSYNIPLLEIPGPHGGYPINLGYKAGIGVDDEASWVGLGWNLNAGAINRQVRGIPDDFRGDVIEKTQDMNASKTATITQGIKTELFGLSLGAISANILNFTASYNNFLGYSYSISPSLTFSHKKNVGEASTNTTSLSLGLGISSTSGITDPYANIGFSNTQITESNVKSQLPAQMKTNAKNFNIGTSYSSRDGLNGLSFGVHLEKSRTKNTYDQETGKKTDTDHYTDNLTKYSTSIHVNNSGYSLAPKPNITNINLSGSFSIGGVVAGAYIGGSISGSYNTQQLQSNIQIFRGYGFLNKRFIGNQSSIIMDFNREKDGIIMPGSRLLATPHNTYDIYAVSGHGMMSLYRPYDSEIGYLHDNTSESTTIGRGLGFDLGIGTDVQVGANDSYNFSYGKTSDWYRNNDGASYAYKGKGYIISTNGKYEDVGYEPTYFRAFGEVSALSTNALNDIGGTEPVSMKLPVMNVVTGAIDHPTVLASRNGKETEIKNTNYKLDSKANPRKIRNTVIVPYENSQLTYTGANPAHSLPEFSQGTSGSIDRNSLPGHHIGGFTTINPSGVRYVYGLPAYNKKQVETIFTVETPNDICTSKVAVSNNSADNGNNVKGALNELYDIRNTEGAFMRTETPKYAHAYLLTAILGTDYVDVDNNGPSQNDLGYWVQFEYTKYEDAYKWRAPYYGANYSKGSVATKQDDKANYMYGEKEVWYLSRIYTKSHTALFYHSQRRDAIGAIRELQNAGDVSIVNGAKSYKLDKIELYTNFNTGLPMHPAFTILKKPIKTVKFDYTYLLCGGVPNYNPTSTITGDNSLGKLTLNKVWFEYQNNTRGSLSPYIFKYGQLFTADNKEDNIINHAYHPDAHDRWGNYRTVTPNNCRDLDFPYVPQKTDNISQEERRRNTVTWNLTSIQLPSGAELQINYESDDYAYVQNKVAMQMYDVKAIGSSAALASPINIKTLSETDEDLKIYFELEEEIDGSASSQEKASVIAKYLDNTGQVYFKTYMRLRSPERFHSEFDYITGYARLDEDNTKHGLVKVGGSTNYNYGYITLKREENGGNYFHPIAFAAYNHLRMNQPQLINPQNNPVEGQSPLNVLLSLVSVWYLGVAADETLTGHFWGNVYNFMKNRGYGKEVHLDRTVIRLNSFDRIKYGGGIRVKKIVLKDNWTENNGSSGNIYGQVYDYTTLDENKKVISSGVAAFEPNIGGDELALRHAEFYKRNITLASDYNLYLEYPINEGYYPSPQVGYSKVTVKSITSAQYEKEQTITDPTLRTLPKGIMTTGAVVQEFYTAKDYPVISDYTSVDRDATWWMIPFPVTITMDFLALSQGYSIELNDMHGKPKKVSNYPQNAQGAILYDQPTSYVEYIYKTTKGVNGRGSPDKLDNICKVLDSFDKGQSNTSDKLLGIEYDFFVDSRYSGATAASLGIDSNFGTAGVVLPWLSFVPPFSFSQTEVRSFVTNKVIHRSGILTKTIAYDGYAKVSTENLLWDGHTGQVVLQRTSTGYKENVSNELQDKFVYSYTIPMHLLKDDNNTYVGMSGAYKNIGLRFLFQYQNNFPTTTPINNNKINNKSLKSGESFSCFVKKIDFNATNDIEVAQHYWATYLTTGDELLVLDKGNPIAKIVLTAKKATLNNYEELIFNIDYGVSNSANLPLYSLGNKKYEFFVSRSGYRNLLSATAMSLTTLQNPLTYTISDPINFSQKVTDVNCNSN